MSIVSRIFMFAFIIIIGVGQGYQPVVGYNYGAGLYKRVRRAFVATYQTTTLIMLLTSGALFLFAPDLIKFFIAKDANVVAIGATALRAQALAMPLVPLGVMCNMTFQTIGKSWTATFLSMSRQGYIFLPAVMILPHVIGIRGVQIAQALADAGTFLISLPLTLAFFRELRLRAPN